MEYLPTIDIAPLDNSGGPARSATVREIGKACHDIGFMCIQGHGVSTDLIASVRRHVIDFFDRPLQDKLKLAISKDNYRGYIPLGFFTANMAWDVQDNYEAYKLHFEIDPNDPICDDCRLYGANKWPPGFTGFKKSLLDYWQACDRVNALLLAAFAELLALEADYFSTLFRKPLTNMTLLHYPPQDESRDGIGIHPHKDTDALTILAPDPLGGLQVRAVGQNNWLEAQTTRDSLIVNIGDMLEVWSGGYFVSTPHRVINTSANDRYSFPYFAVPRYDTVVEPLCPPQNNFISRILHAGDISEEVWRTNWPDTRPMDPSLDLGTLAD